MKARALSRRNHIEKWLTNLYILHHSMFKFGADHDGLK